VREALAERSAEKQVESSVIRAPAAQVDEQKVLKQALQKIGLYAAPFQVIDMFLASQGNFRYWFSEEAKPYFAAYRDADISKRVDVISAYYFVISDLGAYRDPELMNSFKSGLLASMRRIADDDFQKYGDYDAPAAQRVLKEAIRALEEQIA